MQRERRVRISNRFPSLPSSLRPRARTATFHKGKSPDWNSSLIRWGLSTIRRSQPWLATWLPKYSSRRTSYVWSRVAVRSPPTSSAEFVHNLLRKTKELMSLLLKPVNSTQWNPGVNSMQKKSKTWERSKEKIRWSIRKRCKCSGRKTCAFASLSQRSRIWLDTKRKQKSRRCSTWQLQRRNLRRSTRLVSDWRNSLSKPKPAAKNCKQRRTSLLK